MVRALPLFLGQDAHGEDGDYDDEHEAAEAEHILKVAHGGLKVVNHGAEAHKTQQEGREYIGRHAVEIALQLVREYRFHSAASSPSVSSRKMSSRFAFFTESPLSARPLCAKARNMPFDTS